MSSQLPIRPDTEPATGTENRSGIATPIGVDVGVKTPIAAAPADGDLESAFVIESDHLRATHELLVGGTKTLQAATFNTAEGQAQLFAATWLRLRSQLHDAAARLVQYARQFTVPVLVLEDLSTGFEPALWEYPDSKHLDDWLLPALQHAILAKAQDADIPVEFVNPKYTTQRCHGCGELSRVGNDTIMCSTPDCPVDEVCRDRSAAITIANRVETSHADQTAQQRTSSSTDQSVYRT